VSSRYPALYPQKVVPELVSTAATVPWSELFVLADVRRNKVWQLNLLVFFDLELSGLKARSCPQAFMVTENITTVR
jgi:hypothetical protein